MKRAWTMATYTITFGCGHAEEKQLFGPEKERTRKIEYFEREGLCSECYKAAMRKKDSAAGPLFTVRAISAYDPAIEAETYRARAIRLEIELDRMAACGNAQNVAAVKRDIAAAEQSANCAATKPARKAAYEITCIRCYAIKDQLKARGYTFDGAAESDFLGMHLTPGWVWQSADTALVIAELQWAQAAGYEIKGQTTAEMLISCVVLGRPDWLPSQAACGTARYGSGCNGRARRSSN